MISVAHALGGNLLATVMLRDLAGARARTFLCGTKRKGKALDSSAGALLASRASACTSFTTSIMFWSSIMAPVPVCRSKFHHHLSSQSSFRDGRYGIQAGGPFGRLMVTTESARVQAERERERERERVITVNAHKNNTIRRRVASSAVIFFCSSVCSITVHTLLIALCCASEGYGFGTQPKPQPSKRGHSALPTLYSNHYAIILTPMK